VRRVRLVGGVHGDRDDPEVGGGAGDANGDLAPVGDEQARDHPVTSHRGERERVVDRAEVLLTQGDRPRSYLAAAPGERPRDVTARHLDRRSKY
jgi:hypothetical protein